MELASRGYLKQQLAEYIHRENPVEAQKLLLSAIADNPRVLRPQSGVSYKKIPTSTRSRARFIDPNALVLWTKALLADLSWDPEQTDRFEGAMQELGSLLGFGSQRPDKMYKDGGPDNLWAMTSTNFIVMECKSGVEDPAKPVSKDYCNQLLGAESWFKTRYEDRSSTATLILVHPSSKFGHEASPAGNMRVIDVPSLAKLKTAIDTYARSVVFGDNTFAPPGRFAEALSHLGLNEGNLVSRYTVAPA
jgi:hypothetical protein